jgi:hypothetical protein
MTQFILKKDGAQRFCFASLRTPPPQGGDKQSAAYLYSKGGIVERPVVLESIPHDLIG